VQFNLYTKKQLDIAVTKLEEKKELNEFPNPRPPAITDILTKISTQGPICIPPQCVSTC
jgi:hypothetical protein